MFQQISIEELLSMLGGDLGDFDSMPSRDNLRNMVFHLVNAGITDCPFCNKPTCPVSHLIRDEIQRRAKIYNKTKLITHDAITEVLGSEAYQARLAQILNKVLDAREKEKWERSLWAMAYRMSVVTMKYFIVILIGTFIGVTTYLYPFFVIKFNLMLALGYFTYIMIFWRSELRIFDTKVKIRQARTGEPNVTASSAVFNQLSGSKQIMLTVGYAVDAGMTKLFDTIDKVWTTKVHPHLSPVINAFSSLDPRRLWLNGNFDASIKRAQAFFTGLWQRLSAVKLPSAKKETK